VKSIINITLTIALAFMFMGCSSVSVLSHTDLSAPLSDQATVTDEGNVIIAKTNNNVLYHGPKEVEVPEVVEEITDSKWLKKVETLKKLKPAPITVTELEEVILFPYDSSIITNVEMVKVNKIVDMLKEYPDTLVMVMAYASIEGSEKYNMGLAYKRSESVRKELVDKGIDMKRITYRAFGETDIFGSTLETNRRAVVINIE